MRAQMVRSMNGVRRGNVKSKAGRASWPLAMACLAGLLFAACTVLLRSHAQESFPLPAINPPGAKAGPPGTTVAAAAKPNINQQTANTPQDPQKQAIAKQCADLLAMATELKTEVDKTTKDTLSISVVRKAGEIEQLAHKVKAAGGKG